ncbi:transcriptional regulator, TetR family [Frankia torreyi]|uniref:Transcriptional regulator, TetR family n=1 Tax=Frankia torreyi TaxID=1856 RepID=A0A0D8B636_9ACTN|nr:MULTISPECIES: TetR/AcrR family transcriptional regulator [Frankia]KJE19656.1 transcriptional regulator, TetR family [Frankia torreyi]KQC36251.1 TetR family transcriptional regulator [Frankia sp. ACN1ag]KQM02064.1 transcriptional regulator, TetR family [Frankia sp. CpI1-P]
MGTPQGPGRLPLAPVAPRPALASPSPRVGEIIAVAREVLEKEGAAALTMRRLGELLGIRAPSLYKHLAGKNQLEARLVDAALVEMGDLLHGVVDRADAASVLGDLLAAYRAHARAHPNLYRLVTSGPLRRDQLTAGVEDWAGEPFYRATGEPYLAQALWAAAHGTVILELDGRYLPGSDLDRTWAALTAAFSRPVAGA